MIAGTSSIQPMRDRYAAVLAAGYVPGETYGSEPLCFCGRRPVAIVRTFGSQVEHRCALHKGQTDVLS